MISVAQGKAISWHRRSITPGSHGLGTRRESHPPMRCAGFTLVELLVVLIIMSLVMGLVGFSMSRSLTGAKVRASGRDLMAALRYTRLQAVTSRREQRLMVNVDERYYVIPVKNKRVSFPHGIRVDLLTARSELSAEHTGAIRFFPDGSSTGGRVTLHLGQRTWVVAVGWLTGEVSLAEESG